jgi:hypothetical protein
MGGTLKRMFLNSAMQPILDLAHRSKHRPDILQRHGVLEHVRHGKDVARLAPANLVTAQDILTQRGKNEVRHKNFTGAIGTASSGKKIYRPLFR